VRLRLSDAEPLKVTIEANDVVPDAKFKAYGEIVATDGGSGPRRYSCSIQPDKFSPELLVIAENGRVLLDSQDWAASLGLKVDPSSPE